MSSSSPKQKGPISQLLTNWDWDKKDRMVLLSFFLAITGTYFLAADALTNNQSRVLFISIFAVLLWLTEAVPAFAVGVLIIFLNTILISPAEGTEAPPLYYQTWSSPIIFLMLGGFFISSAMKATGLDRSLFNSTLSILGEKPKNITLGLMLITALLSMIMSNTATTAMMVASVSPFINKFGSKEPFTKAVLIGVPTAASLGGMGTIIGSPPNAIAVGALEINNIEVNFVSWMMMGFPLAICLVLLSWFIISKKYPTQIKSIKVEADDLLDLAVKPNDKRLTIATIFVTLALWLTTPFHGFHVAAIAAIPIVVFSFFGIVKTKDVKSLPWDTLMLVAGGLSLGESIQSTGLAHYYLSFINLQEELYVLVFVIFALLTVVLSNIMSNTATTSLLVPIGMLLLPNYQLEIAVITGLAASCAILLPVSTPPNAIAFATGHLEQKDFRNTGIIIGLLAPILITLYIFIFF